MIATRSPLVMKTRPASDVVCKDIWQGAQRSTLRFAFLGQDAHCGFVAEDEDVAGMVEVPRG